MIAAGSRAPRSCAGRRAADACTMAPEREPPPETAPLR